MSQSGTLYHPIVYLCIAHSVYKNVELSFIDMGNKRKGLPHNMPWRPRRGVKLYIYSFFNLVVRWRCGGQLHVPAATPMGKRPGTLCKGGWVSPGTSLNGCRKPRRHRDSNPGPPVASNYTDPRYWEVIYVILLSLPASRYPHLSSGRITAYPERLSWCRVSLISLLAHYLGIWYGFLHRNLCLSTIRAHTVGL